MNLHRWQLALAWRRNEAVRVRSGLDMVPAPYGQRLQWVTLRRTVRRDINPDVIFREWQGKWKTVIGKTSWSALKLYRARRFVWWEDKKWKQSYKSISASLQNMSIVYPFLSNIFVIVSLSKAFLPLVNPFLGKKEDIDWKHFLLNSIFQTIWSEPYTCIALWVSLSLRKVVPLPAWSARLCRQVVVL